MKIRIKGNSVRFRLTQSEVKKLSTEGIVVETTAFESANFTYQVKQYAGITALQANFENNCISMLVPETEAKEWYANNLVGHDNTMLLPSGEKLYLLLEKDFTCMDNTIEDQSDNYPNPKLQ
ncbi:DUF7009 family protein [Croceivirga radicis]|uniref:DUF7009 family protein n=1 Tax=Croceivirga radicis TaxID=1929488 RepID=UPI000255B253|nr:hypothetical protein [Croceivirga radicis]